MVENKCIACGEPYGDHFVSKYFCTDLCRFLYKAGLGEMIMRLKNDENLISAHDHIQLLLKDEAQGDEGNGTSDNKSF